MNLSEYIDLACIRVPLGATDKRGVIDELVDMLADAGRATNAASLKQAVWTREQTRTTGIGQGLAIPHGKSTGVEDLAIAIGKPAVPMDFEAIDSKPVRLIILLASPPDRTSDHIYALAHISRLMNVEEFRDRIYAAESAEEIHDLLRKQSAGTRV